MSVLEEASEFFDKIDLHPFQDQLFSELSKVTPIQYNDVYIPIEPEPEIEEPQVEESEEKEPVAGESGIDEPEMDESEAGENEMKHEEIEEPELSETTEDSNSSSEYEDSNADLGPEIEKEPKEKDESQTINDRFEEDKSSLNDQFDQPDTTIAEHHEETKVDSIIDTVSINHRYMFTQELFDGDATLFRKAINEVEDLESFDDAVEHLVQHYAKGRNWDMNSDEVKELLKIIFRKYR